MGDLLKAEVGQIHGMAKTVEGQAEGIRELTTSPGFDSCASGASGSKIANACSSHGQKVEQSRDSAAARLELFSEQCRQAGTEYGNTEDAIAAGFKAIGDA